jgi:hypothetical protein
LRVVRRGLERPDTITASAVSAREQISQAMAEKIREMEPDDLKRVAEDVLPQIEKFLESPEEKRLRRVRSGVVTAAVGLGATVLLFLLSLAQHDLTPFISLGLIAFLIGLGIVINGLVFTIPPKKLVDRSDDAFAQKELDSRIRNSAIAKPVTNELDSPSYPAVRPSVTEHTTHQLNPNKS